MTDTTPRIDLLAADDELRAAVPDGDLPLAHRAMTLPCVELDAGPWRPPEAERWDGPVAGMLLVSGFLSCETRLCDRTATELFGPGELVDPWRGRDELLPCQVSWMVHDRARLAVLDRRYTLSSRRWPGLAAVVSERVAARADRLASQVAILQLSPVERRVLGTMWQLVERWGRVTPDGIVLPLRMTHQLIGRMVGAQRPTVTLAIQALGARGALRRREDGSWLLDGTTCAELDPSRDGAGATVLTMAR